MLIRYGYELSFECATPTLMVCLLDAHEDRAHHIVFEFRLQDMARQWIFDLSGHIRQSGPQIHGTRGFTDDSPRFHY